MHVLVPGDWTVKRAHDLADSIEHEIAASLPGTTVITHIEPSGDPVSYADIQLDRTPAMQGPPG
jgi:divalent metal cation (Fe/Co/Zn/Cd) transporter